MKIKKLLTEETKMKNDVTIEAEMKYLYDTTVRKGLPDDITIEAEMKHLYETSVGKELSRDDVFEMDTLYDTIFEMLHREEISEKVAEIKLEKLLTGKKGIRSSQEYKIT